MAGGFLQGETAAMAHGATQNDVSRESINALVTKVQSQAANMAGSWNGSSKVAFDGAIENIRTQATNIMNRMDTHTDAQRNASNTYEVSDQSSASAFGGALQA